MAGRRAKTLTPHNLRRMLAHVARSQTPERDRVIVLLSVKAGLRAAEITGLTWSMVLDARGRVGDQIAVVDAIAKKGSGRFMPVHPELKAALQALRTMEGPEAMPEDPIIRSARGGALKPNSLVNWFVAMFAELQMKGCSSHSGRRTFITKAARAVHRAGGSLRDVQMLAGHRSIETTQGYIDGDTDAQRRLIGLI